VPGLRRDLLDHQASDPEIAVSGDVKNTISSRESD
jgi:hypothetical protein